MRPSASLLNTQDQPHPVYLNIRLWAQPSHTCRVACEGTRLSLPCTRHARACARSPIRTAPHFLCAHLRRTDGPVLTWIRPYPLCCPCSPRRLWGRLAGSPCTATSARTRTRASASPSTTTATSTSSTTTPASRSFQLLIDLFTVLLGHFLDVSVKIRSQPALGSTSPAVCRDVGPA